MKRRNFMAMLAALPLCLKKTKNKYYFPRRKCQKAILEKMYYFAPGKSAVVKYHKIGSLSMEDLGISLDVSDVSRND